MSNNSGSHSAHRVDQEKTRDLHRRLGQGNMEQQLLFWALEHSDPDELHRARQRGEGGDQADSSSSSSLALGKTRDEIEEARKWLEKALKTGVDITAPDGSVVTVRQKDIVETMKQCIVVLQSGVSEHVRFSDRMDALIELEECVELIDFANDFAKMGGLGTLMRIILAGGAVDNGQVDELYGNRDVFTEEELVQMQAEALNVMGICAQNNPFVQDLLMNFQPAPTVAGGGREAETWPQGHLVSIMVEQVHSIAQKKKKEEKKKTSTSDSKLDRHLQNLIKKYIFACGCILSTNVRSSAALIKLEGGKVLKRLVALLDVESTPDIEDQIRVRVMLMLFAMLSTEKDAGKSSLARKLFEACQIHRILFDLLKVSIQDEKLELLERALQLLQELTAHKRDEPFKSIVQAIRREGLAESSGFTAFRKKILVTKPPADETEDRWYDVRPYLEQIVL